MARDNGFDLFGMNELINNIRHTLITGAEGIENKALQNGAEVIAQGQREKVAVSPKTQKHIRDDIRISKATLRDRGLRTIDIGPGKKTAWRAKFLEFGTTKMSAKPFVDPSFQENANEALQAIAAELRRGLGM